LLWRSGLMGLLSHACVSGHVPRWPISPLRCICARARARTSMHACSHVGTCRHPPSAQAKPTHPHRAPKPQGSNDISDNLVDSTALRAVVGAMGHCAPTETKALDFAVGVWAHLGRSPERCEACVAAGFVEATVKAILAAPFSPPSVRFLEEACRALATIAFQDKSGHSILREAGALKALQMMLDRFPKEVKVQEMGRALLSEIS